MQHIGTTTVDKAAANRFIKYAIAQVKAQRPPGEDEGAGPSHVRFGENGEATKVPVKVTSKMAARAQYEKELAEAVSEEEEDALEVIDDEPPDTMDLEAGKNKGKGKAVENDTEVSLPGRKRRRPMDPFAGMCHPRPDMCIPEASQQDMVMSNQPLRKTSRRRRRPQKV